MCRDWIDREQRNFTWENSAVGMLWLCEAKQAKAETVNIHAIAQPWGRAQFLTNWLAIFHAYV